MPFDCAGFPTRGAAPHTEVSTCVGAKETDSTTTHEVLERASDYDDCDCDHDCDHDCGHEQAPLSWPELADAYDDKRVSDVHQNVFRGWRPSGLRLLGHTHTHTHTHTCGPGSPVARAGPHPTPPPLSVGLVGRALRCALA